VFLQVKKSHDLRHVRDNGTQIVSGQSSVHSDNADVKMTTQTSVPDTEVCSLFTAFLEVLCIVLNMQYNLAST